MKRALLAIGIVALLAAGVSFERSDYALHGYRVPGHTGVVVGDCYHFDAGVELQTGAFVDQC
jgi:hypothetical protein